MLAKLRPLALIAVLAAFLAVPASSQATLVFTRSPLNPAVFVANDDGSAARKVGPGSSPRVSPDGQTIAFYRIGRGAQPAQLMVAPAAGGAPRKLAGGWQEPTVFAWSSDSTTIAVLLGPEVGKRRLVTIDVASGAQRTIARGYFSGVSFAPGGSLQLVYARAAGDSFPPRSDLYRIDLLPPGAVSVAPVLPRKVTTDQRSTSPLWGPGGEIVFVKQLGTERRNSGPRNELFLMKAGGGEVRRLTRTKVDPLLLGLVPTEWSADGRRLLAEFIGQDTSYAVTVNPRTGAQRALTKNHESGFVGTALSADGGSVLGFTGGFEPGPRHNVVRVPYEGGRARVLARNAFEPDWSR